MSVFGSKVIPQQCPQCKRSYVPVIWIEENGRKMCMCLDCYTKLKAQNAKPKETERP